MKIAINPTEAVSDILRDRASGDRMLRLLQGDVGSGKTVVALLALATAIESGAKDKAQLVNEAGQTIDKAAGKGVVHKNKAARKKSRLAKKLNAAAKA